MFFSWSARAREREREREEKEKEKYAIWLVARVVMFWRHAFAACVARARACSRDGARCDEVLRRTSSELSSFSGGGDVQRQCYSLVGGLKSPSRMLLPPTSERTASLVLRQHADVKVFRQCSTSAAAKLEAVPEPQWGQLCAHALRCGIPMVGFGIIDNLGESPSKNQGLPGFVFVLFSSN